MLACLHNHTSSVEMWALSATFFSDFDNTAKLNDKESEWEQHEDMERLKRRQREEKTV